MISLEKAKALKEAGLKWEPKKGDWYFYPNGEYSGRFLYDGSFIYTPSDLKGRLQRWWLPRLDQLLTEIEARGYWWEINHRVVDKKTNKYKAWVSKKHSNKKGYVYEADTPEDAAASALLWILEQEKATKCKGCVCDDCDGTTENAQCPDTGCLYCPSSKDCEAKT